MGRDKASIILSGLPLWQRQIKVLNALCPNEILISGRLDGPYSESGFEIVADTIGEAGPLAGVAALLARATHPLLLVLAVDMPFMTTAYLSTILKACGERIGVVAQHDGLYEPLAAAFPKAALPLAEAALSNGDHSLQRFVRDCFAAGLLEVYQIAVADLPLFRSVNSPTDLTHA